MRGILILAILFSLSADAGFGSRAGPRIEPRIVGGEEASPGEFPYVVSLHEFGRHICGATLVKDDWVLTAAHCVTGGSPQTLHVGLYEQKKSDAAESFRIARVVVHPENRSGDLDYDFALIQLRGHSKHPPVAYQRREMPAPVELIAAGWGRLSENDEKLPDRLRKVVVPLVPDAECQSLYGQNFSPRMLCAGYAGGGRDACLSDSGGPLLRRDADGSLLVGVVSWGVGCARPGHYGVYAKVSSVAGWIDEVTGK